MPTDPDIDRLYQLPLDKFTPARNALASQVRKAGDLAGALRVKGLAKPSMSAWAVNQLYWRVRPDFDAMVKAGDAQRLAEQRLLAGAKADARAAGAARDAAIARALKTIDGLAAQAGVALGPQVRQRIKNTLEAIATEGSASATPFEGRLAEDVETTGFGALARLAAALPPPAPEKGRAAGRRSVGETGAGGGAAAKRKTRERETERARARAALAAAESHARALRDDAGRAARELADAEARAARAREDVDLAKRQLADAMRRATKAIDQVKEAKRKAAQTAAAAEKAEAAATLAERHVKTLGR